jgi:aerobic-type carbon monoxide dehydrogenase small subunit (CoxS/CutS family)
MRLVVNGAETEVDDRHETTPLLWVLRDVLGFQGTKFGCGAGFCAACTVLIDGQNQKSCQIAAGRAVGQQITTVEGVSGNVADVVRTAWYDENVVQCGYCQPGQTLAAIALLESNPEPDDASISRWMNGNLCRCGTYPRIRKAIHDAAAMLASDQRPGPLEATAPPEVAPLTEREAEDPVHPYIRIKDDGTIVVFSSQIEMGQGIHTGLATLVAEELDADFASIRVVNAANGRWGDRDVYGNPDLGGLFQITGASNSTKGFWSSFRPIAAKARARLVAAAAEAWSVPSFRCVGHVRRPGRARRTASGAGGSRTEGQDRVQADRERGPSSRRHSRQDPGHDALHDRHLDSRVADCDRAPSAAIRRDRRGRGRRGCPRGRRCGRRRRDRRGRRGRR